MFGKCMTDGKVPRACKNIQCEPILTPQSPIVRYDQPIAQSDYLVDQNVQLIHSATPPTAMPLHQAT